MTKNRMQNTEYKRKIRNARRCGMTLIEIIISLAIITIILVVTVPQFAMMRSSWASKASATDVLQNGRILMEHLERNLSKAIEITAVSSSSTTNGYIQFVADDGNSYRYDINPNNNYVEYGAPGHLSILAGPTTQLLFSCYDACNLDTPLNPITDPSLIRCVKANFTLYSTTTVSQSKTFTTQTYLRTNSEKLLGWWKFDEGSGYVAIDSSGNGYNGTIYTAPNAYPPWRQTSGSPVGNSGYLYFNGNGGQYVDINYISQGAFLLPRYTIAAWFRFDGGTSVTDERNLISVTDVNFDHGMLISINRNTPGTLRDLHRYPFQEAGTGDPRESLYTTLPPSYADSNWHHVAAVRISDDSRLLYVDGNQVGSIGSLPAFDAPVRIILGALFSPSYSTGGRWWYGAIDDVRVYNYALSSAEIAQLANPTNLKYLNFTDYGELFFYPCCWLSTPPGTQAGDLLIAAISTYGDNSSSITPPSGEGWQLINCGACNGDVTLGAWWKIASASEPPSHMFCWSQNSGYGWMMHFSGQNHANPINATAASGQVDSCTPTSPAVTTTTNDCLILRLGAFEGDNIQVGSTGLSGYTTITMNKSNNSTQTVTYQGFRDAELSTAGNSITIPTPAGTSQTDFLIAAVATSGSTWGDSWSAPSGWNQVYTCFGPPQYCPSAVTLKAWEKTAGASEPSSYTFSWGTPEQAYGWIIRLSGQNLYDTGYPFPSSGTSISPLVSASNSYPDGPPNMLNYMFIPIGAFANDAITVGNPGLPGYTPITMNRSNTGPGSVSGGAGYVLMQTYALCPASNFSLTASEAYSTITLCIWPNGCYGNSCSGGAGYIVQPAVGSSGTSNFQLNSPTDARMITIAIAPDPNNFNSVSGEEIHP
jgi:prepilin-type N-terminal cleavage/methylation domain-containing protein